MILWLWLIFLAFGLALLFFGYKSDDQILLTLSFIILILPAWALTGFDVPLVHDNPGIQYTAGENTTTTYSYNNTTLTATTEETNDTYTTYKNRTWGLLLLFAMIAGFWLAITNIRNTGEGGMPRIPFGVYKR